MLWIKYQSCKMLPRTVFTVYHKWNVLLLQKNEKVGWLLSTIVMSQILKLVRKSRHETALPKLIIQLTQQIFMENFLCARQCSRHQEYSSEQNQQVPLPEQRLDLRETGNKYLRGCRS